MGSNRPQLDVLDRPRMKGGDPIMPTNPWDSLVPSNQVEDPSLTPLDLANEKDAVAAICREYGLRTALERSLALIIVRNLRSAQDYATLEDSKRAGRNWYEQRIELIHAAAERRLKAERGAFQGIQALVACRIPPTVNIVAANVDIGERECRCSRTP